MKTKTTIILALTLLVTTFTSPLFAQDASNDATWEETTSFVKKHQDYMKDYWDNAIKINENTIEIVGKYWEETLDLYKLKAIEEGAYYGGAPYFSLVSSGNYVEHYDYSDKKTTRKKHIRYIEVGDDELQPRLAKAFKHLAYLATEKRKAAREASGDKF